MVQMMSTARAGRPSKAEKASKSHTHNAKSDGPSGNSASKNQATTEQMRLAQIIKSSEKGSEDPELEAKIKQVAECTGRSHDDSYLALHDCDMDLGRAIEQLLENEDQGEWQEKKGKKKKQAAKAETETPAPNQDSKSDRPDRVNDHNDFNSAGHERSGSAPRGRRNDRAPPRFQRAAAGRGKNDDDRDGSQRGDRGRGRTRSSRGRGRGRGAGSGSRRDYNDSNRDMFQNGPQIDTWTNDTAATKKESSFGTWGDMSEDWTNDEWTGSLKESKVFTPSGQESANKVFSSDNDAKMFSVTSIETQVFNSSMGDSLPGGPSLNDSTGLYQHAAPGLQSHALGADHMAQDPLAQSLAQKPIGQNALGQSAIGQNPLGTRLDLGMLLGTKSSDSAATEIRQTEELTKQTADLLMAQYQKEATECIKSAVGIGNSSQSGSLGLSAASPEAPVVMSQNTSQSVAQGPGDQASQQLAGSAVNAQQQQQRAKPQRTKLPPPSKIPQSAVVMPGGMNFGGGSLDVKFGTWDQGDSPSDFNFGTVPQSSTGASFSSTNATSSVNNHMSATSMQNNHINAQQSQTQPQQPPSANQTAAEQASLSDSAQNAVTSQGTSILDSMVTQQQSVSQSPRPAGSGVYQNKAPPATPPKDYTQSTKISSPPEPIPFPTNSQSDRKSPYQPSGPLASESAGAAQQLNFSQSSNYSSAYNTYKPSVPSTVSSGSSSYSQQGNGIPGQGLQDYRNQSSAFQSSQSGYTSQGQSSLYPNASNPPSSFQSSQNVSSYQGGSSGGYLSQSSYHNRDSQSAPAFQSSASQSGSTYQNSVNQSGGSSYQRDSESSQSAYGNSQNAYGSSSNGAQKLSSSTKLNDSLGKLSVKDTATSLDPSQSQYDSSNVSASSASLSGSGASTNASLPNSSSSIATGSVSVSAVLGLSTPTANNMSAGTTVPMSSLPTSSKSTSVASTGASTKAPPNLPQGGPPVNYMPIGQPGFPIATAFGLQQPPMYSYEDLLLSQQRLQMPSYYDNLQFQPTPTTMTMTGVDHSKLASGQTMGYAGAPDANKLNRVDAQSPTNSQVASNQSAQSAQSQQSSAHGGAGGAGGQFMHSIPPGYHTPNYYYAAAAAAAHQMPPPGHTGYTYPHMMLPNSLMTQVTNAGASTASNQFPKGTYGFGSGTATQDFNKAFMGGSQTQTKGSVSTASSISSSSDLNATGYPKTHGQTAFDKSGFAASTPPPFGMAGMPSGTQAGNPAAMGGPAAAYVQYMPGLAAGQPSAQQMLAHQLHQDTMGGSNRGSQQSSNQPKGLGNKSSYGNAPYWPS